MVVSTDQLRSKVSNDFLVYLFFTKYFTARGIIFWLFLSSFGNKNYIVLQDYLLYNDVFLYATMRYIDVFLLRHFIHQNIL